MGKKWKWVSKHRAIIIAAVFLIYVVISLNRGTPDPRLWLSMIPRQFSSSIITETIGRIVNPGGSSGPGEPPPAGAPDVGIYSTQDCTTTLPSINWGTLYPGSSKTHVAYIKNIGTVPFTLGLSTAGWSSGEAEQYLTLSWDYQEGRDVPSSDVVKVVLRLDVSPDITGVTDFSFDIVVTAIEVAVAA